MADTKIIVTSSDSNSQLVQKTIPNINPNADNSALKSFGQKVTALTDNTLSKVERVDKTDITAAVEKLTPSLVLTQELPEGDLLRSWIFEGPGRSLSVDYTGDGELSIVNNDNTSWMTTFRRNPETGQLNLYVSTLRTETQITATAPHDIVIRSAETDDYKAGEFIFTIIEG